MNTSPLLRWLMGLALVSTMVSGWAQSPAPNSDPWESFNRRVFGFNEALDGAVLQPVARTYRDNIPQPLQKGVSNFFATHLGIERHTEDFGQTLGRWGVPGGPYVVLPLFGPSSVRDGIGLIPDNRANLINQVDDTAHRNTLWVSNLVDRRAQLLPVTDQVDRVALDKYSFTRDAYLQKRLNDVYDGNPPENESTGDAAAEPDAGKSNP